MKRSLRGATSKNRNADKYNKHYVAILKAIVTPRVLKEILRCNNQANSHSSLKLPFCFRWCARDPSVKLGSQSNFSLKAGMWLTSSTPSRRSNTFHRFVLATRVLHLEHSGSFEHSAWGGISHLDNDGNKKRNKKTRKWADFFLRFSPGLSHRMKMSDRSANDREKWSYGVWMAGEMC